MSEQLQSAMNLGPVNQIGFVVKDLAKAIEHYTPLFGEFNSFDVFDMEWEYRGSPDVSSIKIAIANSGDVEIELIEWVSGKTPHKDFLDAGHEGLQHLRFLVDNLEEKVKQAEGLGYQSVWYKRFGVGLAAAYLQREGDPLYIELFENKT
ncbi:MAG: VOC family protein [Gammaproteobacteria bacterium]|nr:VOC family protein [Gammaproteobacteria bacterium]MBT8150650.1 VOC family protein [Gammaproteobacteria bacterium]NND38954.1 hypothetical protein [Pseudomonadales bacterium]NNL10684.1 hypothetical protein [Pseudomonadales bacterium]NNM11957.1 hypothetical protein [Pseudomonadales bacterium]